MILRNVLLSTSVCYFICNFSVPRKWQAWKNSMSASDFASKWGKMLQENFKCWKGFLESTHWEEHKFLSGFPVSKMVWLLFNVLNTSDEHEGAEQIERWFKWRKELVLKDIRYTIWECSDIFGISFGLVQISLTDYMNVCLLVLSVHEFLAKDKW
jgi:hypothetical protein